MFLLFLQQHGAGQKGGHVGGWVGGWYVAAGTASANVSSHVHALCAQCSRRKDRNAAAAAAGVLNFVDARTSWFDTVVKDALARHNISQVGARTLRASAAAQRRELLLTHVQAASVQQAIRCLCFFSKSHNTQHERSRCP